MRKLILRLLLTLDEVAAGEHGNIDNVDYGDASSWDDIFRTVAGRNFSRTSRANGACITSARRRIRPACSR